VGYDNGTMNVVVFEGVVRVCNLAGICIDVKAGQMGSVRNSDNSGPSTPLGPQQATLDILTQAAASTDVGGPVVGVQTAHHISKATGITLGVIAAVPLVVVPVVSRGSNKTTPAPPPPCNPRTNPKQCG
jgi:hypothetical protein